MFQTFRNAWKIEELRKKILFTLLILLLYRLGNAVPVPDVNTAALSDYFTVLQNTVLGLYNTMSGGAFSMATIFALSIQPYINASIIIQLLCIAIPALERLSKEGGEEGRKKIGAITRYSTVGIGLLQGLGYFVLIKNNGLLNANAEGIWPAIVIIMTFTAGSALVMWLGEQITEFGIGNGISVILFASIVSRFPTGIGTMITNAINGFTKWWIVALMLIGALLMIVMIVFVSNAERRIPVQYAKRVVGRKMYGGQSSYIPLRVDASGVLPLIFASSIMQFPSIILGFFPNSAINLWWTSHVSMYSFGYQVIFALMIVGFTYFYSSMTFNPGDIAKSIKENGGSIPGIRQGKPTEEYIRKISTRINLFDGIYLAVLACLPTALAAICGLSLPFAASSLLIAVSVATETTKQIESELMMHHYKGFLK